MQEQRYQLRCDQTPLQYDLRNEQQIPLQRHFEHNLVKLLSFNEAVSVEEGGIGSIGIAVSEQAEDVRCGKQDVPDRLGFKVLVLLHHQVKGLRIIHEDDGDVHDHQSLLRIVERLRSGKLNEAFGAVSLDDVSQLLHGLRYLIDRL